MVNLFSPTQAIVSSGLGSFTSWPILLSALTARVEISSEPGSARLSTLTFRGAGEFKVFRLVTTCENFSYGQVEARCSDCGIPAISCVSPPSRTCELTAMLSSLFWVLCCKEARILPNSFQTRGVPTSTTMMATIIVDRLCFIIFPDSVPARCLSFRTALVQVNTAHDRFMANNFLSDL